jgi:hypothetical protein
LPCALKTEFVSFLDATAPHLREDIVRLVHARRRRADAHFLASPLPSGVRRIAGDARSVFDTLAIARAGRAPEELETRIAEALERDHGVVVMPGVRLFPPGARRRGADALVRLSYGAAPDVNAGLERLSAFLAATRGEGERAPDAGRLGQRRHLAARMTHSA